MSGSQSMKLMGFLELLREHAVEIPIIQRDYAQGRKNQERIRNDFLSALKEAIGGKCLELDFIYGDVQSGIFRPLDGQQRLTTLFLLHWYAATRNNRLGEVREDLKKFKYETRVSSREFCYELVMNDLRLRSNDNKVECIIRNSKWYRLSWDKDTTIAGMLRMLNAIEERFSDVDDLLDRLKQDPPPIRFHFIKLEDFGLSDDLYVKMNARGKQLTSLENFKARMEKKIDSEGWDDDRKRQNAEECFSVKADTVWTDLFWRNGREQFDDAYLRFIANALLCSLATESKPDLLLIRGLQGEEFEQYISPDGFNRERYETLQSWLDVYCKKYPDSSKYITFWNTVPDKQTLFSTSVKQPTWPQIALFYAQTAFLIEHGVDDASVYSDWMRVVRNIVHNQAVEQVNFVSAIRLIKELLKGATNIYGHLADPETKIRSGFAERQMKEERLKARLIVKRGDELKELLHRAEDTTFCKGHISFALYCAEFSESDPINSVQRDILEKTVKVLESECFCTFDGSKKSDPMRRALLCIDDGKLFQCLYERQLYAVGCPKYRLIPSMEVLQKFADNDDCRDYLKELVRQIFQKGVDDIIADHSVGDFPTWRDKIIKQPQLLAFAQKKRIALDEEQGICWLIPLTSVNNDKNGRDRLKKVMSSRPRHHQ